MSADHATTDGLREAVIDALYKADSIISWMLHRRASRLSDEDRQQLAEAMSALAKIDGHRNYRAALAAHPVPSDTEEEREVVVARIAKRRLDLLRAVVSYDNANQSDLPLGLLNSIRAEVGGPR